MEIVDIWTGRRATALRNALRLTNEGFAELLGTSVRTVAKWSTEPELVPYSELQRALDTTLARASDDEKKRFSLLVSPGELGETAAGRAVAAIDSPDFGEKPASNTELRLNHDPDLNDVLDWLDDHAKWEVGEARHRVTELLRQLDMRAVRDKGRRRGRVSRETIATALADFYGIEPEDHRLYRVEFAGTVSTSIWTRPEWLNIGLVLGVGNDHLRLRARTEPVVRPLDDLAANAAALRIAEALATDTRLVNRPLYRLLDIKITEQSLSGEVSLTDFGSYALTMDLLENELLNAVATKNATAGGPA